MPTLCRVTQGKLRSAHYRSFSGKALTHKNVYSAKTYTEISVILSGYISSIYLIREVISLQGESYEEWVHEAFDRNVLEKPKDSGSNSFIRFTKMQQNRIRKLAPPLGKDFRLLWGFHVQDQLFSALFYTKHNSEGTNSGYPFIWLTIKPLQSVSPSQWYSGET